MSNPVLLIDNYDSFVFNIARYVKELGYRVAVVRHDKITLAQIEIFKPSHIIISPGPCTPNEAGISLDVIRTFGATIPLLGICLGHQAIGQIFGGDVTRALRPMHGKASLITHQQTGLFQDLPSPLSVGRYHSLIVAAEKLPTELVVDAYCELGEIMAMHHKQYPIYGVQFHPESILTEGGMPLLRNFLRLIKP